MSIKAARHNLLYLKDVLQGTIYAAYSNSKWLTTFSPILSFAIRPMLGLTLSTLALLQAWSFFHLSHKNFDGWLATVGSLTGALFNNTAAFGAFFARLQGVPFPAAPWLFVTGFSVGAVSQLCMMAINTRRAYESPAHSVQRKHFLQTAVFNLVTAMQLSSCVTAIIIFNLFPAYSLLVTCFALTVVTINLANSVWRSLSGDTKKNIKKQLGLAKPVTDMSLPLERQVTADAEPAHYTRLFTTCDHCEVVKHKSAVDRIAYLHPYIVKKLAVLERNEYCEKNEHKMAVLKRLEKVFTENMHKPDKGRLHKKYPRVVDNFWCEKSDTDRLIDAVIDHCQRAHDEAKEHKSTKPSPSAPAL